ncbi:hypothetical protein [Streptomyces sp. AD55]|uniref:hypothetical protein n=1 Tax=Streptomyces sp. AD55 TaxID=3242895 RepID=UPI0035288F42
MTDRRTADTITDDHLDALYAERDRLADRLEAAQGAIRRLMRHQHERVERVRAVADRLADGTEAGFRAALAIRETLPAVPTVNLDHPQHRFTALPVDPEAEQAAETRAREMAEQHETNARMFAALHKSAEDTVTRVITLHEQWVAAGPPPLGTSLARWWDTRLAELHDAIQPADRGA